MTHEPRGARLHARPAGVLRAVARVLADHLALPDLQPWRSAPSTNSKLRLDTPGKACFQQSFSCWNTTKLSLRIELWLYAGIRAAISVDLEVRKG